MQFDALLGMEEEEKEEEEEEEMKGSDGKDRIWYKYILFFMMFCMISDGKRLARRCAFLVLFVFFSSSFSVIVLVVGSRAQLCHFSPSGGWRERERGEE